MNRFVKLLSKRCRLEERVSVHWRLITLELLLMRLQRPTRRDLGELVHILVINDEVWNDELEALLKRVKRLSEPSDPAR